MPIQEYCAKETILFNAQQVKQQRNVQQILCLARLRFFFSPVLFTSETQTAEVPTGRNAEQEALPKLLPGQTNVLSFFVKQQDGFGLLCPSDNKVVPQRSKKCNTQLPSVVPRPAIWLRGQGEPEWMGEKQSEGRRTVLQEKQDATEVIITLNKLFRDESTSGTLSDPED
ncbi:hypothetical protein DUI87_22814 [Hirundo rustica rustica]|uniref:Uncharacterized protein n=1 Tax=Hirundo rustica rustica TaxID=333673 RepID=A0A3M0JGM7_HIRRU|nr:hypothetical protein DUI87_22814 [Hirundo rustica rustica]